MQVVYARCAGLDVHKKTVSACVSVCEPEAAKRQQTRVFGTFTCDLLGLTDWLKQQGVTQVAMEATGVYWRPVWAVLEGHFEQMLVNPHSWHCNQYSSIAGSRRSRIIASAGRQIRVGGRGTRTPTRHTVGAFTKWLSAMSQRRTDSIRRPESRRTDSHSITRRLYRHEGSLAPSHRVGSGFPGFHAEDQDASLACPRLIS